MKIAILGSGPVGFTMGSGLLRLGHEVMIGTRHTTKDALQQWLSENPGGRIGAYSEAAAFGEVIIICVSWTGAKDVVEMAGIWNFKKKIVIDITNPLDGKGPDTAGRLSLDAGNSPSGGEQLQSWLQDSMIVKALNIVGNTLMVEPEFSQGTPTMLIAGNDDLAKMAVTDLLSHLGWKDVEDVGDIEMSRHLESLCVIWCAIGFRKGSWNHAFSLLRK